jgi:D-glycero-D-manno-heptose 1,7-bisphosphate phosphatase
VINQPDIREGRAVAPTRLEDFRFMPGIHDLVGRLRKESFKLLIVTNQPDVVYGRLEPGTVEKMHELVRKELQVDEIYVCFHVDADGCQCRKPRPGMLLTAAKDFNIDLSQSFIIGDTWRDIGAGKAAGCNTILLSSDCKQDHDGHADSIAHSLQAAGELIFAGTRKT